MKKFLIITVLLIMISCEKNEEEIYGAYLFNSASFYVVNQNGEDLLNPNTSNNIIHTDIRVIYIIDEKEVVFYDSRLVNNRFGYAISKKDGQLTEISFLLNIHNLNANNVTYIDWGNGTRNKIDSFVYHDNGAVYITKTSLNDELYWEAKNNNPNEKPPVKTIFK